MTFTFADRMNRMQRSTIREILKITKNPDIISFAGGLPAPELFPAAEFADALQKAMREDSVGSLQYDVTEGYRPLKIALCQWLESQGVLATPENLMLTNGSQQALDLIGKVFINPGDKILVENPTYLGAIQAFNAYQASYATVEIDDHGPLPQDVQKAIAEYKPRFAYVVPTFQNPSGITMTLERREAFLKHCTAANLPIVEDDPYGYLRFSGKAVPSLYTLAKGKGIIYLSTFSKILSPGIRLGFVLAEPELINALILAKQAADLQPNSLVQRAVYHYMQTGHMQKHVPLIIRSYGERAQWMLSAIRKHFPKQVQCVEPEGGMFIWCRLPKGFSATDLFAKAVEKKVAYVTGSVFFANGGGDDTFRLNFTNSTQAQIEKGIASLGGLFREAGLS